MPPRGTFGTADTPRVATLADLPATAADGMRVNVTKRRSIYEYDATAAAWTRTTDCDPAWARSADVYVNYSTGSDDADGTLSAPLATVTEAVARLGDNTVNSSGIFWIHMTGNATETKWDLRAFTTVTQPIVITGEPTVLLSTTVTAVAWNAASNTRGTITGASSIAAYAASSATTNGSLFRVVGGARDGMYGTLQLHTGGGAVQYDLVSYWWTPGGAQLQTGDTIEILSAPAMPPNLLVRRGTVVFLACLSGLTGGLHAGTIEPATEGWFSSCSLRGDLDSGGGWLSIIGCTMAGHAARVESGAGYLEIDSGRVYGVAVRSSGEGHLSNCTVEERIVANEGGRLFHENGHVWLAHSTSGSTIELHPGARWWATATCVAGSGVICGTGLAGGTAGMMRLHEDAIYRGPVPVCTGTGTQINLNGTAKNFSDAASYVAVSGAAIGPRSAT